MPAAIAGTPATTNSTQTTSKVFNMPAGIVAGELLVAVVNGYDTNPLTATPSSGWTQQVVSGYTSGQILQQYVFTKTAAGSDTLTVGWSANVFSAGAVFRVDGHGGVDVSNGATSSATNTIAAASVTSTVTGLVIVGLGDYNNQIGSSGLLSGYTDLTSWDSPVSGRVFYKASVAAGTVSPGTITAAGFDYLASTTLAIKDAGGDPAGSFVFGNSGRRGI